MIKNDFDMVPLMYKSYKILFTIVARRIMDCVIEIKMFMIWTTFKINALKICALEHYGYMVSKQLKIYQT